MQTTIVIQMNPPGVSVAQQCAGIHAIAIPDGFLPSLGNRFLTLLYQFFANSEKTFLLVAIRDNEVLGFFCGSLGTGGVYKDFLLRSGVRAVIAMLPRLVYPSVIKRIFETLFYPKKTESLALPDAEILNFCVSEKSRGTGVGRALFEAGVDQFVACSVKQIRIITGADQTRAQDFYERAGARKMTEINIHGGVSSLAYIFDLKQGE